MLEVIELNGVRTTKTVAASNHVYLVDVSGSMYYSLAKMKEHLKNSISMLSKPDDTFSVIYFSGRGQCGVVCEGMEVRDLQQMQSLHAAVDRWLNVIGLTGFMEPLKLAQEVAQRRSNNNPNNFVMLTDGYDNCWQKKEIIEEAAKLPEVFGSCSFIEFGWYCDRELITKMAEACGGVHLFSEGYIEYEKAFADAVTHAARVPRIAVNVNKRAKHAVYVDGDQIIVAQPVDGVVSVPETVERVHSIVPSDVLSKQLSDDHVFMVMYYAAKTNNSKLVWDCLERLGDVRLIRQYNTAFSKQELTDFVDAVKACAIDSTLRFVDGRDSSFVPAKDAFTVLDLLNSLAAEDSSLVREMFKYNRIGSRKEKVDSDVRFVRSMSATCKITSVVANSNRANFSIQVVEEGNVTVPENEWNIQRVKSKQTKTYSIVRDGIINVDNLPVVVSNAWVRDVLDANSVPYDLLDSNDDQSMVEIHIREIPLINRNMIESVSLEGFKQLVVDINENAAKQKVLKHLMPVNRTTQLATEYGEKAAEWLSSLGIRDYGFSPYVKTVKSDDPDVYIAHELTYGIRGLSSLPSINAVEKKLKANGKLTTGEALIAKYLNNTGTLTTAEVIAEQRKLLKLMSEYVYAIVVGRAWFDGIEDRTVETTVDIGSAAVKMKIDLKEVAIAL